MTNKGVHAQVTQAEVDTCVMQTYLLAGEVLQVLEGPATNSPAESSAAERS